MSELDKIIHIATQIAKEYQHESYGPVHIIKALLHKDFPIFRSLFNHDVDVYFIEEWSCVHLENYPKRSSVSHAISADNQAQAVLEEAEDLNLTLTTEYKPHLSIFIAAITPGVGFSFDQLKSLPVTHTQVITLFNQNSTSNQKNKSEIEATTRTNNLTNYTRNLVLDASEGAYDVIIGRDREIKQVSEILNRKSKPHVIILGESGVGKTAFIKCFAAAIHNKKIVDSLKNAKLFEINTAALLSAAAYKGEIEDRLVSIFKDSRQYEKPIIFIDDFHTLLEDKSTIKSIANTIKSELNTGGITLITATTSENYRKLIAIDEALERRMEKVNIEEPDDALAFRMIKNHAEIYTKHHELNISDHAIKEIIRLAKRYLKEKCLPDSAIDLIDRTMSAVKVSKQSLPKEISALQLEFEEIQKRYSDNTEANDLEALDAFYLNLNHKISAIILDQYLEEDYKKHKTSKAKTAYIISVLEKIQEHSEKDITAITESDLAAMVSIITGIPAGKVQTQEKERLLDMEAILRKRVIGQDSAIKTIADAIVESRSGLSKPGQPIGSFFFSGPTGTGKTELAKSLAEFLFNDENAIIRFDMSEFKEEHSAALLYGAPPGYVGYEEGGVLVNKIRQKPYSIVLFDEIEKAHQSVFDVFLQILDEGKLHDRLGKVGDFANAVILFTSNIGSDFISKSMEKGEVPTSNQLTEIMANYFRPEFLGRITEIVPFAPISENNAVSIFNLHLQKELLNTAEQLGITINIDNDTRKYLALNGFSPVYGVRPLKGVIRNQLKRPLAKMIISDTIKPPQVVEVRLEDDLIAFNPQV
ncbi:ATP-dependent Clp protease ATP-binding subunit [Tamlana sp. 2_MG-2023]|uniref:AAA family ATPase n=1 Tax=unclassified Tamlana TaxID=2614803 RepID=UPI0026E14432|nr:MULTISPECIES: ATP-dependent Clp protease ATP-binding subunit [unclassified Tamlana]MDO6761529.1 ATP-dependent Clp protease ATP-binding subunit [Tamlana sp. 2_MG-2023]MDO6792377.1 ATP-dependent Clp protease ATP-binding subunit [Tamlana sp. 1_MG-2023]